MVLKRLVFAGQVMGSPPIRPQEHPEGSFQQELASVQNMPESGLGLAPIPPLEGLQDPLSMAHPSGTHPVRPHQISNAVTQCIHST